MLASSASKEVKKHVPVSLEMAGFEWPQMAGFGVATEGYLRDLFKLRNLEATPEHGKSTQWRMGVDFFRRSIRN